MADDLIVSKRVFFVGAWRAQTITDHLLRQISAQMSSKKGYPTNLNLTGDGLHLFILNSSGKTTRTDNIPLHTIVDMVDNKYSNSCLLAIVKDTDATLFTVFGFLVSSKSDADEMIYAFKKTKQRLKVKHGKIQTVTTKTSTSSIVQTPAPIHVRVETRPAANTAIVNDTESRERREVRYHAVQPVARHNNDSASISTSSSDVRDELATLTKEVRDIKLMLQHSKGPERVETHYGYSKAREAAGNPLVVSTNANVKIYDEVPEQRADTKQTVYQRNVQYINRNAAPGYMVVQGDAGRDRAESMSKMSHVSTSSRGSLYSKLRYDSGVEMVPGGARSQRSAHQGQSYVRVVKGSKTKYVPSALLRKSNRGYYSDTVQKSIEDVYRNRSLRRPIAVPVMMNPQRTEYYQNVDIPSSSTVKNEEITVSKASATEVRRDTTQSEVTTTNTEGNVQFVKVYNDGAVVSDFDNKVDIEVFEVDQTVNVSDNSDESVNVMETSQTSIDRHLELIDNLDDNADYEPVTFENPELTETKTIVKIVSEETHIDNNADDNVVFVASNSDNKNHVESGASGDNVIQKEVTFSVKTEIITTTSEIEDGEDEIPIIVPEIVDRYHINDENDDTDEENNVEFRKEVQDSTRTNYMTELKQNINEKRGLFEDRNNNANTNAQTEDYVLDAETLKRFSAEPNIVIVSKEEEATFKTNINGDIRAYESAELDIEVNRGEDTVLF